MATVTGEQVAEKAKELLSMGTIPYVLGGRTPDGMDCQGLVRWVLEELEVPHIKGSNNQWRNMTSDKGTIEEGVEKYGEIPLGALIFICDYNVIPDGYSDPPDAEHVYIKIEDDLLIHASYGNQMVCTRSFADETIPNGGPTHYALIDGVEYEGIDIEADSDEDESSSDSWSPKYTRYTYKYKRKSDGDLLCKGDGVREIQNGLNLCGYDLEVDGEFGPLTEEAVIEFQEDHDLEADGIVGKNTWAALIEAANEAA